MTVNSKKTDIRYVRTESAIQTAFLELVTEIGFYAITVKDITAKADVSRGTFYQHYNDKYDLLASYEKKIKEDLLAALTPGRIPFKTDAVKEHSPAQKAGVQGPHHPPALPAGRAQPDCDAHRGRTDPARKGAAHSL